MLDAIETRRAAIFIGVPAMYRMLLEAGAGGSRPHQHPGVGGPAPTPCRPSLAARFKKLGATVTLPVLGAVGEAPFVEGYGMVELGGGAAAKISPPFLDVGLGSDAFGFPLPGYHFRVVDPDSGDELGTGKSGELLIKGPGVTSGYWGDADATAATVTEDGWLRTGDLARLGPFGTVLFEGRAKDVIKVGGYSVYALEVERAIEEHPDVLEAAVVAAARRPQGRGAGGGRAPGRGADARCRALAGLRRRTAGRLQGPAPLGGGRGAAAHRHEQGEKRELVDRFG